MVTDKTYTSLAATLWLACSTALAQDDVLKRAASEPGALK
ncbi:MAG: hypothetical protein OHK0044_31160 [Burkholderiaceae bacterium]